MRIRPRLLVAGAGLTVLLAVGVPAVASAESGSTPAAGTSTSAAANCPAKVARRSIATYVAAHSDAVTLLDQLRAAPAGQRAQVAQTYLSAHPQTKTELLAGLKQLRQHARSCRAGGH